MWLHQLHNRYLLSNLFVCYIKHNLQRHVGPQRVKISPLHLSGVVCHWDICNGSKHACQDCGVWQHQETRRDRFQKPAARFVPLRLPFCVSILLYDVLIVYAVTTLGMNHSGAKHYCDVSLMLRNGVFRWVRSDGGQSGQERPGRHRYRHHSV